MRPVRFLIPAVLVLMQAASAAASGLGTFPPAPAPFPVQPPAKHAEARHASATPLKQTSKGLVEPHLRLARRAATDTPKLTRIALTFDACSGETDPRILSVLVDNRIPATIFATARWLRRNPQAVTVLKANPDLFEVENHGAMHVPAVDHPALVYGIEAAGSPQAVETEVKGGAEALVAAGFPAPKWFRGATARYDTAAIEQIGTMGYRVAGYSLNGDDGSLASAASAEKRLASARDGSVIIAHINQPAHPAGEGIAKGILALKARGVTFVRLSDAVEEPDSKAVH